MWILGISKCFRVAYSGLLFISGSSCESVRVAILKSAGDNCQPLPESEGEWETEIISSETLNADAWVFALGSAGIFRKLGKLQRLEDIAV